MIDLDVAHRAVAARRPPVPLLLSLLLVLLLGSSAPLARSSRAVSIPATFRDDTFVDGDRLFVVGPEGSLRTYHLPDGRPLGQMQIGYPGSVSGVREVGGVLLVLAGGPRVTVAFDAASGAQLWSSPADLIAVAADGTVLLTDDLAVWAVDPHSGSVRWRIDQPTLGARYRVAAGLDSMTSYDRGAVVATQGIHLSGIIYSYISDSRFVVGDSSGLSAYRLPSLTPLWHVPTDPREQRLEPGCVRVLCSYVGTDAGVTVRDPATGRTLFSSPRWATVSPLGPDLVAAADPGALDGVRLYLLDPATGRVRGDFGDWRAVLGPGGALRYALYPATTPNDYLFGELDPAHATVRVLGTAPQVSGHCDVSAGALIYHRPDGTIAIWRFDPHAS